jgi:DNA-binding response OmpR family regulator
VTERALLVIDDDAAIVQLFQAQFSKAGYTVRTASNGEKGLEIMHAEPVDLVLTDFMMPNLNGIEFARIVQTQSAWAQTKIIFMSANEQPEFRARALELGAIDYLPKSLGAETIVKTALEHLGSPARSSDPHETQLTSLAHRLDRIELLADHLIDLIALMDGAPDTSDIPSHALQSLRQTALKIRDTAHGAESTAPAGASIHDRLLA